MKKLIRKILQEEVVSVTDIQDELLMMPLDARQKLRDDLSDTVNMDTEEEYTDIDEQISYKGIPEIKAKTTVGKLLKWVKRYVTDKATNFLINASMDEIKQTIDILDVMDPTSTVGIFKPKAMYLGGGIDFAKDAVSWRSDVEEEMLSNVVIEHKGCDVGVGSGFDQSERRKYFKNPELIIGKTITVQYFEETLNQDGCHSLRFPVVKHVYDGIRTT